MKNLRVIGAARGLIFDNDGRLLLVSNSGEFWYTPGGWVDGFEDMKTALKREIYEELGIDVCVGKLCFVSEWCQSEVFNRFHENIHKFEHFFFCEIISGQISEDWKDSDNQVNYRRFFTKDEVLSGKWDIVPRFIASDSVFNLFNRLYYNSIPEVYMGALKEI